MNKHTHNSCNFKFYFPRGTVQKRRERPSSPPRRQRIRVNQQCPPNPRYNIPFTISANAATLTAP